MLVCSTLADLVYHFYIFHKQSTSKCSPSLFMCHKTEMLENSHHATISPNLPEQSHQISPPEQSHPNLPSAIDGDVYRHCHNCHRVSLFLKALIAMDATSVFELKFSLPA
ncbi:hypothetical protein CEXT_625741 [Caerostris extrusa]|uniref:Uncharacterized protein n=1 Tax=Caerostris extrusa TaxID=172846 RepID=A0AAV4MA58_CAEEX|nr:hypothetical protein CEXT_625741 [Caerostris extrusa]